MQIHVVSNEFSMTPFLREYLERRLQSAFSPVHRKMVNIAVRLRDLNGPRGGCDMLCQVSVKMQGKPEVVVKEVQENMYNAIDRAVKRAAYRMTQIAARQSRAVRRIVRPASLTEKYPDKETAQAETGAD
jgi:ribosomal subunit interface protein